MGKNIEYMPADEPNEIILSVTLGRNGRPLSSFDASVRVPLSEAANFDNYTARWLTLMRAALSEGVAQMSAVLALKAQEPNP